MKTELNKEIFEDIFKRVVDKFIDSNNIFLNKLKNNPEKIIIKYGVDPTKPDLHLGHAVILRKLRIFQNLGCKIVFLIGDFTSLIGDPTGKSKIRPEVTYEEINKNMETYLNQVGLILDTKNKKTFDWTKNSDWFFSIHDIIAPDNYILKKEDENHSIVIESHRGLSKDDVFNKANFWVELRKNKQGTMTNFSFFNILAVLRKISLSQLIERDMFQNRIKKNEPIFMSELLYPVLQGIDSTVIYNEYGSCDLEVGGTDQYFNMLLGRNVMEMGDRDPQAVLTFKLLVGLDGKEKMSKSLNNYVSITDNGNNMYGKIMSIPDSCIVDYFEFCTDVSLKEISEFKKLLENELINPKDLKMKLSYEIVKIYHGESIAKKAQENFINTFQKKEIPDDVSEINGDGLLLDVLITNNLIKSKGEGRRLLIEGAIYDMNNNKKLGLKDNFIKGNIYRIGKHKFIKIK